MPGNFQRFDAALASAHFRRHDFYQSSSQCSKRERDPRPHAVAHQSEGVIGACWNVTLSNLRFIARTRISARCALGSMSTVEVQDLTSSGNATYRYWSATAKCVLAGTCASFGQFFARCPIVVMFLLELSQVWSLCRRLRIASSSCYSYPCLSSSDRPSKSLSTDDPPHLRPSPLCT
jgi:hypothetical protein